MENESSNESSLNTTMNSRNSYITRFKDKLMLEQSENVKTKLMELINTVRVGPNSKTLKQVKDGINSLSSEFQSIHKENSQNYENNLEAIENIVSKALHDELMNIASQKLIDEQVTNKMKKYAKIQPKHIEINADITASVTYDRAIQDQSKVDYYKSPKDKLVMIVNACKLVNGMVWENSKNKDVPTGADDFLPVLIFTTIKACPERPASNLNFIRELRSNELLKGFSDYYLTAYESVLDFIERLDISRQKITKEEHENLIAPSFKNSDFAKDQCKDKELVLTKKESSPGEVDDMGLKKKLQFAQMENIENLKAIHLGGLKDYLYSNNKHNFKHEGKSTGSLFVDQLEGFFYEYNLVMRNYKKLSERVEHIQEKDNTSPDKNIETYLAEEYLNNDSEKNSFHKNNKDKKHEDHDLI